MWWFLLLWFSVNVIEGGKHKNTILACSTHLQINLKDYWGCNHILIYDEFLHFSMATGSFQEVHEIHFNTLRSRYPDLMLLPVVGSAVSPEKAASILYTFKLNGIVLCVNETHQRFDHEVIEKWRKEFDKTNLTLMLEIGESGMKDCLRSIQSCISSIAKFDYVFASTHTDIIHLEGDNLKSLLSGKETIEKYLVEQGIDRRKILVPFTFLGRKREINGSIKDATYEETCNARKKLAPYDGSEKNQSILTKDEEVIYFHHVQSISDMAKYTNCLKFGGVIVHGVHGWKGKCQVGHLIAASLDQLLIEDMNFDTCKQVVSEELLRNISKNINRKAMETWTITSISPEDNNSSTEHSCSLTLYLLSIALLILTTSWGMFIYLYCYQFKKSGAVPGRETDGTREMHQIEHERVPAYVELPASFDSSAMATRQ